MKQFPKYSREENRACKLTDAQIAKVKKMREVHVTYANIAKLFGVTEQAIYYWCLDDQKRKEIAKRVYKQRCKKLGRYEKSWTPEQYRQYRERKKTLHPELKEYERQFIGEIRKNRPNYQKSIRKSYLREKEIGYLKIRNDRFINKWGKDVWAAYHRYRRQGIYKSFADIKSEISK